MLAGTLNRKQNRQEPGETTRHFQMTDIRQDIQLIQRIAVKDEVALHELYTAYGQRLFAYALRLTNDNVLAEDIVQDTLVTIWQSATSYRGESRLLAWLLGIVHHTASKSLRHRSSLITDEMENNLTSGQPSPEEQAVVNEQSRRVQQSLQDLSPEHRAVLDMVFYQGLNINEIAEVINCPAGTVKSRLSYARKHLKGLLVGMENVR